MCVSVCFFFKVMFKFNFKVDQDNEEVQIGEDTQHQSPDQDDEDMSIVEIGEFTYEQLDELKSSPRTTYDFKKLHLDKDVSIEYLSHIDLTKVDDKLAEINRTHDVVAGEYEGGLKIWELSIDMAHLIYNNSALVVDELGLGYPGGMKELRVIELGCGHALPSLSLIKTIEDKYTSQLDPNFKLVLYLQDFNKKVKISEFFFKMK